MKAVSWSRSRKLQPVQPLEKRLGRQQIVPAPHPPSTVMSPGWGRGLAPTTRSSIHPGANPASLSTEARCHVWDCSAPSPSAQTSPSRCQHPCCHHGGAAWPLQPRPVPAGAQWHPICTSTCPVRTVAGDGDGGPVLATPAVGGAGLSQDTWGSQATPRTCAMCHAVQSPSPEPQPSAGTFHPSRLAFPLTAVLSGPRALTLVLAGAAPTSGQCGSAAYSLGLTLLAGGRAPCSGFNPQVQREGHSSCPMGSLQGSGPTAGSRPAASSSQKCLPWPRGLGLSPVLSVCWGGPHHQPGPLPVSPV